jgi:uncharacterized repeat protein (TIGR02543 family)
VVRKGDGFSNLRRRARRPIVLLVLIALAGCRLAPFDLDVSMSAIDDGAPSDLFLLTFDGNGNDGGTPPPANDYPEGHSVTLPDNIGSLTNTTPPGYTFIGWNTQADGFGTSYPVGDVFIMPASPVTLYAHWTDLPTYTVTYDANGADGGTAPADQTKTEGIDLTLATNSGGLGLTGHTFVGWNTANDGSGTHYAEGATYSANANLTLYAEWTLLPTYTVTYDANGADGGTTPADQTKTEGIDLTLAANSGGLALTGSTFAGWNTQPDGLGVHYAEGAFYTDDANLTLYAEWTTLPTYTVTYNANGADGGTAPADQTKTEGIDLTLATNSGGLGLTGHTFTGWNTANDGLGVHYAEGATYSADANLTLYAEWTPITYTLTYDANGAGGLGPVAGVYNSGDNAAVAGKESLELMQDGISLRFTGWNTVDDGSGTAYQESDNIVMTANVTLWAQWDVIGGGRAGRRAGFLR